MTGGWTGKKGNGKSFLLAKTLVQNLRKNYKWHTKDELPLRKSMVMRTLGLRESFRDEWKEYIEFFDNIEEVPAFKDSDVYCDDITLSLSARNWEQLPLQVQDWLTGSERLGCHVYFTAVRFKRVVIDFRENTDFLSVVTKGIGSRRPTPTIPPPRKIWGVIFEQSIPEHEFTSDGFNEALYSGGKPHLLKKKYIDIYDHTNVRLRTGYPDFTTIKRWCYDNECPEFIKNGGAHMKVRHI